nr:hypothetical protein [Alphaproteobacteria bacterium]
DTTPSALDIPYNVQVATSSRQSSSAVVISGMSSGATQTLSVTATAGNPKFTVNGGAEVDSASVANGDSIVFKMDAPAGANASNKMTITAGSMTAYWRVWTGWDGGGSGIKRVFVTSATYVGNIAATADSNCQTRAAAAALGGTWKAIISYVAEANWAVNRVGYNWNQLQLVDGTTVVYAPNLWSTSPALLSPIIKDETGATRANVVSWANTNGKGLPVYTTLTSSTCTDWTFAGSGLPHPWVGNTSFQNEYWIARGDSGTYGAGGCNQAYRLYCIEQ